MANIAATRLRKMLFCASHPWTWRHVASGVAPSSEHIAALAGYQFDTVLDVGANRGQFAMLSKYLWPKAKLYCFEPLEEARNQLEHTLRRGGAKIYPVALGQEDTCAPMYVAERDDSSSLLAIGERQTEVFGTRLDEIVEDIQVRRLDTVRDSERFSGSSLLKIDVQGAELSVLRGAEETLRSVSVVYVECSYRELYLGQALVGDVIVYLLQHNFRVGGVFNQYCDRSAGALQADFLFVNENLK